MRALVALLFCSLALAGCTTNGTDGGTDCDEGELCVAGPPQVTAVVQVDAERWSGEPSILALDDGTLLITGVSGFTRYAEDPTDVPCKFGQSYLWRSTDNGTTWSFVDLEASPDDCVFYRNAIMGIEGDLARDDAGRAYFVDLTFFPGVNGLSVSEDSGETWMAVQNPAVGLPAADRPWVSAHGDGEVWVKYLTQVSSPVDPTGQTAPWRVARSTDAGLTFLEDLPIPTCSQADMFVDAEGGYLLIPCDNGGMASMLRSPIGQSMAWERLDVAELEGPAIGGFPGIAVAGPGQYAMTWVEHIDGTNVLHLATSADYGATWSEPTRISSPGSTVSFPWIDGDADGRMAVVWYEAAVEGNPNEVDAPWFPMHASFMFGGALYTQPLTEDPVHVGSICDQGLMCVVDGRAEDRRLLDFFEIDIQDQYSHITWTSTQTDVPTIWYGQVTWPDA